jgi:hypothetical protein
LLNVLVVSAESVATTAVVTVAWPVLVSAAAEMAADCESANPATAVPMIRPARPRDAFSAPAANRTNATVAANSSATLRSKGASGLEELRLGLPYSA